MKPSAVLTGFLFGSSAAISFGLFGVAFVFWLLAPDHPELAAEIGPLVSHLVRFVVLTLASAASFYATLTGKSWRWLAQLGLVLALAGLVLSYWLGR